MRSIQDVGTEILGNDPAPFYIFTGCEYGIKSKYIDCLKSYYHGEYVEFERLADVINIMTTKHFIPLKPALYVVRYDEEFISSLDSKSATSIPVKKIIGTIVCIYEDSKQCAKISKFLGDYAVELTTVSDNFLFKYIHSDFPKLPSRLCKLSVQASENYGQARQVGYAMSQVDSNEFDSYEDEDILKLFGHVDESTDEQIKLGVASKSFNYLCSILERYEGTYDTIIYSVLSTMVELDKIKSSKYSDSDLRKYANIWTTSDIYYMFMHGYDELKTIRSASVDPVNRILYLFSLLQYKNIPDMEVLS